MHTMKKFNLEKYINTLGSLRKAVGIVSFVCWAILTLAGIQVVSSLNEAMFRFFIGPLGAGLLVYYLKRRQYKSMLTRFNKNEPITWEPLAYGLFIMPITLTVICLVSFYWHMVQPVAWIPAALLINVGIQYAFFAEFGAE